MSTAYVNQVSDVIEDEDNDRPLIESLASPVVEEFGPIESGRRALIRGSLRGKSQMLAAQGAFEQSQVLDDRGTAVRASRLAQLDEATREQSQKPGQPPIANARFRQGDRIKAVEDAKRANIEFQDRADAALKASDRAAAEARAPELEKSLSAEGTFNPTSPKWIYENAVESAPQMAAQIAAAALTRGAGVPFQVGAFAATGAVPEAGGIYAEARKRGVDHTTALTEAAIGGTAIAALDTLPGSELLLKNPASKKFFSNAVKSKVGDWMVAAGGAFTAEAITEAGQDAVADTVRWIAENDPKAFEAWQQRYPAAALIGGVVGGTVGASGRTLSAATGSQPLGEQLPPATPAPAQVAQPGTASPVAQPDLTIPGLDLWVNANRAVAQELVTRLDNGMEISRSAWRKAGFPEGLSQKDRTAQVEKMRAILAAQPQAPSPATATPTNPPAPQAPSPPAAKGGAFSLPRDLTGAKPRYSYGSKQFELEFANDLDKSLYILAQPKPSRRDADYLQAVVSHTGMTEEEARAAGADVRNRIKDIAKTSRDSTIKVPAGSYGSPTPSPAPATPPQSPEIAAESPTAATETTPVAPTPATVSPVDASAIPTPPSSDTPPTKPKYRTFDQYGPAGRKTIKQLAEQANIDLESGDGETLIQFGADFYGAGRRGEPMPQATMHPEDARLFYAAGGRDGLRKGSSKPKAGDSINTSASPEGDLVSPVSPTKEGLTNGQGETQAQAQGQADGRQEGLLSPTVNQPAGSNNAAPADSAAKPTIASLDDLGDDFAAELKADIAAKRGGDSVATNTPPEPAKEPAPEVGYRVKLGPKSVRSVLAKTNTFDGVRYELFRAEKAYEPSAIRIIDEDSGKLVTLEQHPDWTRAEAKYDDAIATLKRISDAAPEKKKGIKPVGTHSQQLRDDVLADPNVRNVLQQETDDATRLATIKRVAKDKQARLVVKLVAEGMTDSQRNWVNNWNADSFSQAVLKSAERQGLLNPKSMPESSPAAATPTQAEQDQAAIAKLEAEVAAKAKALADKFRTKLGANPLDPELISDSVDLTISVVKLLAKKGQVKFREYVQKMRTYFDDATMRRAAPYLQDAWDTIRERVPSAKLDESSDILTMLEPAEKPKSDTPDADLASRVADALDNKETITAKDFFAMADDAYGGTRTDGTYGPSDAYDALETGVNKHLIDDTDPTVDASTAKQTVKRLDDLIDQIPSQTNRSGEKDTFQQFSTPPAYAYTATWVANIEPTDVVLEPSAGVGGIAVHAKNTGATVYGNEYSQRRAKLLGEIGLDEVTTEDAEQAANVLPGKLPNRPTVVVMNPPFSHAGQRLGIKKVIGTDLKHVNAAMDFMQDGGRLVAIVGAPLHGDETATFKNWYRDAAKKFNVRANVILDRGVYKGYGTTFPTRVLVIDKTGATPTGSTLNDSADSLNDLIDKLEDIRNDRTPIVQSESGKPDGQADATRPGSGGKPELPVLAPTGDRGPAANDAPGTDGGVSRPGPGPGGDNALVGSGDGATVAAPGGKRGGKKGSGSGRGNKPVAGSKGGSAGRGDVAGNESVGEPAGATAASESTDSTDRVAYVNAAQEQRDAGELTDSMFEPYRPSKLHVPGAQPHPGSLVESAAMSAIESPEVTYQPAIPRDVIAKGLLSESQLEPIVYAGQAHQKMMPPDRDGVSYRQGYMVGDGTGVGKGREIAGVILDNFKQGRKKAVWVSKNTSLINSARRDWKGIGQDPEDVKDFGKTKLGAKVDLKEGVMFVTYGQLRQEGRDDGTAVKVGEVKQPPKSRIDQLVEWLGKDFDGVIAFDEAHLMANAAPGASSRGASKPSEQGLAGLELQRALPNARILYVTATAATEVRHFAYAERLRLWGNGTAFANMTEFVSKIADGGVAAMELVSRDLKAFGKYLARSLSFNDGTPEGTVEFDRTEHKLTDEQRAIYDRLADAWQIVLRNINDAIDLTGADTKAKSAAMSQFWGSHQRFFNQIITSMQLPSVISAIEKDMADGKAVVIQLTNTGEAAQDRALSKRTEGDDLADFDSSPADTLIGMVESSFPVRQYEEYMDDEGNVRMRPAVDSQGNPILNQQAVAMRDALVEDLRSIQVPNSPIDALIDHFGHEQVAEITGRSRRVILMEDDKGRRVKTENRRNREYSSKAEAAAFMGDKKRILVFSEAGGTGESYHADRTAVNQRKRRHYLLQAGWKAAAAVQGLGRTHRTNQAQAPEFILVHTNLEGQKRFISTIARRLAQLGALTKGQREAGSTGIFTEADNLESTEARDALQDFVRALYRNEVNSISIDEFEQQMGLKLRDDQGQLLQQPLDIRKFLNRILSLKVDAQNSVFGEFETRLRDKVARAKADGTLDSGIENLKADHLEKLSEIVAYTDEESGAKTRYVKLRRYEKTEVVSWPAVRNSKPLRFVKSKNGKVYAVQETTAMRTDARTGDVVPQAKLLNAAGRDSYVDRDKLESKDSTYTVIPKDQEQSEWEKSIGNLPEFDESDIHLITGVVLPVWNRLSGPTQVRRMITDDGEHLLGRIIPPSQISAVLHRLGVNAEGKAKLTVTPQEAIDHIMEDGSTLILDNGWRIKGSRVQNEERIEIVGPSFVHNNAMQAAGVFRETINSKVRYFIPAGSRVLPVMTAVLNGRPVVEVQGTSSSPAPSTKRTGIKPKSAPSPAKSKVTREDLVLAFPGAAVTKTGVGEHTLEFENGRQIKVRQVDNIEIDWDAAEDQAGREFSDEERAVIRAAGSLRFDNAGRGMSSALAIMDLANGLADGKTVQHEAVHVARKAGMFKDAEWKALVRKHSKPNRTIEQQEEDVAKAREDWNGDDGLGVRIKDWLNGILAKLGITQVDADAVHRLMSRPEFWLREPASRGGDPSYQLRSRAPRPDLANPATPEEARTLVDEVDAERNASGRPGARRDADVAEEARQALADDYAGERARLLEVIREGRGLSDKETLMAKSIINRDGLNAVISGNDAERIEAMRFIDAYRESGAEQARAFRQRRDPVESPTEKRKRIITEALAEPSEGLRGKIEDAKASKDYAELEKLYKEAAAELKSLLDALKAAGFDLADLEKIAKDKVQSAKLVGEITARKSTLSDALREWWMNSILGAAQTFTANLFGNTFYTTWHFTAERLVEATINEMTFRKTGASYGEFKHMMAGILPGIARGFRNAIMSWKTELPTFAESIGRHDKNSPEKPRVSIPGKFGKIVRVPQRLLTLTDELFKSMIAQIEVGAQAYRIARSEGLSGKAMSRRMAVLQADVESPAWDAAYNKSLELTHQQEGHRALKSLKQNAIRARDTIKIGGVPILYFVMPFINTPVNLLQTGIRLSPLGSISLASKLVHAARTGEWGGISPRIAQQVIAWGVAMMLWDNDDEDPWITGADEASTPKKKAESDRMFPAMSVKFGDKWYSYSRIEPFATALALTVDTIKAAKSGEPKQMAKAPFTSLLGQVKEKTFLKGLADVLEAVYADNPEESLAKWASSFAASWIPNYVRSTSRAFQDTVPERSVWGKGSDWTDMLGRRTSQKTETSEYPDVPKYDLWGRAIKSSSIGNPTTDIVWRLVMPIAVKKEDVFVGDRIIAQWNRENPENQKHPETPNKYYEVNGEKKYMTEQQYGTFVRLSGELAREVVGSYKYDQDSKVPEALMDQMSNDISAARRAVKEAMLREIDGKSKGVPAMEFARKELISDLRKKMQAPMPKRTATKKDRFKERVDAWQLQRKAAAAAIKALSEGT